MHRAQLAAANEVEYWSQPEKAGWVLCQGEVVKSWRKRWLVLKQVREDPSFALNGAVLPLLFAALLSAPLPLVLTPSLVPFLFLSCCAPKGHLFRFIDDNVSEAVKPRGAVDLSKVRECERER